MRSTRSQQPWHNPFLALPHGFLVIKAFEERVKREYEFGIYLALASRVNASLTDEWLRQQVTRWLKPVANSACSSDDVSREARRLADDKKMLPPLALGYCTVDGSAALLINAINEAIRSANWSSLALLLIQLETWSETIHLSNRERPWWELEASAKTAQGSGELVAEMINVSHEIEAINVSAQSTADNSQAVKAESMEGITGSLIHEMPRVYFKGSLKGTKEPFEDSARIFGHLLIGSESGFVSGLFTIHGSYEYDGGTRVFPISSRRSVSASDSTEVRFHYNDSTDPQDDEGYEVEEVNLKVACSELSKLVTSNPGDTFRWTGEYWCSEWNDDLRGKCRLKLKTISRGELLKVYGTVWPPRSETMRDSAYRGLHPSLLPVVECPVYIPDSDSDQQPMMELLHSDDVVDGDPIGMLIATLREGPKEDDLAHEACLRGEDELGNLEEQLREGAAAGCRWCRRGDNEHDCPFCGEGGFGGWAECSCSNGFHCGGDDDDDDE